MAWRFTGPLGGSQCEQLVDETLGVVARQSQGLAAPGTAQAISADDHAVVDQCDDVPSGSTKKFPDEGRRERTMVEHLYERDMRAPLQPIRVDRYRQRPTH